jgi:hypothetical protein
MARQRQDVRKSAHSAPLVLLAGLPHPNCGAVAGAIETDLSPSPRVIFEASGTDDSGLYRERKSSWHTFLLAMTSASLPNSIFSFSRFG